MSKLLRVSKPQVETLCDEPAFVQCDIIFNLDEKMMIDL
jgi:hypothetical protein